MSSPPPHFLVNPTRLTITTPRRRIPRDLCCSNGHRVTPLPNAASVGAAEAPLLEHGSKSSVRAREGGRWGEEGRGRGSGWEVGGGEGRWGGREGGEGGGGIRMNHGGFA